MHNGITVTENSAIRCKCGKEQVVKDMRLEILFLKVRYCHCLQCDESLVLDRGENDKKNPRLVLMGDPSIAELVGVTENAEATPA